MIIFDKDTYTLINNIYADYLKFGYKFGELWKTQEFSFTVMQGWGAHLYKVELHPNLIWHEDKRPVWIEIEQQIDFSKPKFSLHNENGFLGYIVDQ